MKCVRILSILLFVTAFIACNGATRSVASDASVKSRGVWDSSKNVFIDTDRNLQWDLSWLASWRVAEERRLPQHTQFCAAYDEGGICVLWNAIPVGPEEKNVTSIWNVSQEFMQGLVESLRKQSIVSPGLEYAPPKIEKVKFLFKDALRISLYMQVTDARLMTDDAVPFAGQMYAFIKDDEVIETMVMIPQFIIDEYGDDLFGYMFTGFSNISVPKELQ